MQVSPLEPSMPQRPVSIFQSTQSPREGSPEEHRQSIVNNFEEFYQQVVQRFQDGQREGIDGLSEIVNVLRKMFVGLSGRLDFDIYNQTDIWYLRVIDRQSGEIIKTIPAEEVLRSKEALIRTFSGFLVDKIA